MSEQKKVKPNVEDVVSNHLSGDTAKNALDFVAFMKQNKLSLRHTSGNNWKAMYRGKSVCYMLVNNEDWILRFSHFTREKWFVDYDKHIVNAGLKEFILDNVNPRNCPGRDCNISRDKTILGKTFDEVCTCWPLYLRNLDGADLDNIKKFVLVVKQIIADIP